MIPRDPCAGFSHTIRHLDGHEVSLASDGVTVPSQWLHLVGEGMPVHGGTGHGDLWVLITVTFPRALTASQATQIKSVFESVPQNAVASGTVTASAA